MERGINILDKMNKMLEMLTKLRTHLMEIKNEQRNYRKGMKELKVENERPHSRINKL